MNYYIDYSRLSYLGDKLKSGIATKQEKDEYMLMLYNNGSISQNQYNDYLINGNKYKSDEIVNAALSIGAVLLIGYIIGEMFKGK